MAKNQFGSVISKPRKKQSLAQKAYALAKKNQKMEEIKHFSVSVNNSDANYTGSLATLCDPGIGDNSNQRDGDNIFIKGVDIRGLIREVGTATAMVRIIVFWDKENLAASAADYLAVTGVNAPMSPKNVDKRFRYQTLWDHTMTVHADRPLAAFHKYVKVNKKVQFTAGTTTILTGSLKMIAISNINTNPPKFDYITHSTYTD